MTLPLDVGNGISGICPYDGATATESKSLFSVDSYSPVSSEFMSQPPQPLQP